MNDPSAEIRKGRTGVLEWKKQNNPVIGWMPGASAFFLS
jgi:hypothetical protein